MRKIETEDANIIPLTKEGEATAAEGRSGEGMSVPIRRLIENELWKGGLNK